MNTMDALDVAGSLAIALGSLPIAAAMARLALQVLITALMPGDERLPS